MKLKHQIELPQNLCADLSDEAMDTMIKVALNLEPLWENAVGKNWKKVITPQKLRDLYLKM